MGYEYSYLNTAVPNKKEVAGQTPNEASRVLIEKITADGNETYLDRFARQQPQCSFGLKGTCCKMCQWGPCRITEKTQRGVCGKTEEEIVISNILRALVAGLSAHARHAHEVLLTVIGVAEGKIDIPLIGTDRIRGLAGNLGLDATKSDKELAGEIAGIMLDDLSRMDNRPLAVLSAFAPKERIKVWESLDILPRSSAYEVMEALHMTTLGGCSDWTALARQEQRAGLAYCYNALFASSLATEMLYGIPEPAETFVNYGILEKEKINVLLHGHSPVMAEKIIETTRHPEIKEEVFESGATGINLAGLCCTGTEMLSRHGLPAATNVLGQELIIGTGAVDCVVADMQCVIPGLKMIADCYGTKVITTSNSNRIPGAIHLPFDPEKPDTLDADALTVLKGAVTAFRTRDRSAMNIPGGRTKAITGWSYEGILKHLGGLDNIIGLLREGRIRGIATVVGCNTPKVVYENNHVTIASRLLEGDILILTTGCSSYALLNAGLCHPDTANHCGTGLQSVIADYGVPPVLSMGGCTDNARTLRLFISLAEASGIPMKDLPFIFVGPEPGNEKTIGQGLSFLLHGVSNVIGFPGPIPLPYTKVRESGAADDLERVSNPVADYFGADGALNELGAKVYTEPQPELAAQIIRMHIERKRITLGWKRDTK